MAIFYLKTRPFSRKNGRSIVKHIANLFGQKLFDVKTKRFFNATKKEKAYVLDTALHLPREIFIQKYLLNDKNLTNEYQMDRQTLWNLAEFSESRCNSRTCREMIVNMPCELNFASQKNLMNLFAQYLSDKYAVAVDAVLRSPSEKNDQRSFRVHFMLTTRVVELNEHNEIVLGKKSILEWSNTQLKKADLLSCKDELKSIRKTWEEFTNRALQVSAVPEQINCESYADQGLKTSPSLPLGPIQFALEKKEVKTKRGDYNRQIILKNQKIIQTENLYEQKSRKAIELTNTYIEEACAAAEATDRAFIKREKFASRSDKTNQFIEKYHYQTTETDRRIAEYSRAKS